MNWRGALEIVQLYVMLRYVLGYVHVTYLNSPLKRPLESDDADAPGRFCC